MGERLAVAAVTLDFGNTLVRTDRASFAAVMEQTGDELQARGLVRDRAGFLAAWAEERDRQFAEEVPRLREVDMEQRAIRVLARQRGVAPPAAGAAWDDAAAAAIVDAAEIAAVLDVYSAAFVVRVRPIEGAGATVARLAADGYVLAILSNWPLAVTVDRYAEAQGWLEHVRAVVVSQRIGVIKPHPDIFAAVRTQLGLPPALPGSAIVHTGDDWAADVVGAKRAGWRAAYLRGHQLDTPLPTSEPGDGLAADGDIVPDLVLDELAALPDLLTLDVAAAAALDSPPPLAAGA